MYILFSFRFGKNNFRAVHLGKGKESDNILPSGIFQNVPFWIFYFASKPSRTFYVIYYILYMAKNQIHIFNV